MQEPQQTSSPNTFYNLVSVLYHALEEAQTCAGYVQDAQQNGDQNLVQFFQETQQQATARAERAKQLLNQAGSSPAKHVSDADVVSETAQYGTTNPNIPGGASF
jgi:hypothetical protein